MGGFLGTSNVGASGAGGGVSDALGAAGGRNLPLAQPATAQAPNLQNIANQRAVDARRQQGPGFWMGTVE